MSEVFEGYERQYCDLSANVSWKCNSFATSNLEQKQRWLSELKVSLDEADVLIEKMDLEARSLQPWVKVNVLDKVREYKADLVKVKKEFERLTSPTADQAAREELLELASADQREKMTMCLERINQSGERITGWGRVMQDSDELGVPILQDLHQQRETLTLFQSQNRTSADRGGRRRNMLDTDEFDVPMLENLRQLREALFDSHDRLREEDDTTDESNKGLITMSRRISRNKWIVGSVIGVLVLAIVLIIYLKR